MEKKFFAKIVIKRVLIAAMAVIFLFVVNSFTSKSSFFDNLFSTDKKFVGNVESNSDITNQGSVDASNQYASIKKPTSKTVKRAKKPVEIHITQKQIEVTDATTSTPSIPRVYIKQIQTGNSDGARNEFIELCNLGDSIPLKDFLLKKKTSSGREGGLISDEWPTIEFAGNSCVYLSNAEANISHAVIATWAKSKSLAEKNNTLLLYYRGVLVDEVFWDVIPKGKSIIRDSPESLWRVIE